ncbi:Putative BTB/POZ domain-containing protein [Septoria linicola]|uniref:BTB/POZ domain-containing protein n=1 Tax=Septoria linicola TaxID=215465 RepID=A0A9Q9AVE4_9PEZI|nr:Putative BTB/POZ domain-containing protein [Septoria linicola]
MAATGSHDHTGGAESALQRLYETGEWSDLTIEAGGKLSKVHKNVVCPANAYFKSACTRGFSESLADHIKLPESEKTIDAILRRFYQVPTPWCEVTGLEAADGDCTSKDVALNLIELRIAIDKYGIDSMEDLEGEITSKIEVGCFLFDQDGDCLENMRDAVIESTASFAADVFQDLDMFDMICKNMEFMRQAEEG